MTDNLSYVYYYYLLLYRDNWMAVSVKVNNLVVRLWKKKDSYLGPATRCDGPHNQVEWMANAANLRQSEECGQLGCIQIGQVGHIQIGQVGRIQVGLILIYFDERHSKWKCYTFKISA